MPITEATFQSILREDPEGQWEKHRGRLREKTEKTASQNQLVTDLAFAILQQLDRSEYTVRINSARVTHSDQTSYFPDLFVVPTRFVAPQLGQMEVLEHYEQPLPFVAELWTLPTGAYDVEEKLPAYKLRGDAEIWRIHSFDRVVTIWHRQPDGDYSEETVTGGRVQLHALPSVTVEIEALFITD